MDYVCYVSFPSPLTTLTILMLITRPDIYFSRSVLKQICHYSCLTNMGDIFCKRGVNHCLHKRAWRGIFFYLFKSSTKAHTICAVVIYLITRWTESNLIVSSSLLGSVFNRTLVSFSIMTTSERIWRLFRARGDVTWSLAFANFNIGVCCAENADGPSFLKAIDSCCFLSTTQRRRRMPTEPTSEISVSQE